MLPETYVAGNLVAQESCRGRQQVALNRTPFYSWQQVASNMFLATCCLVYSGLKGVCILSHPSPRETSHCLTNSSQQQHKKNKDRINGIVKFFIPR